MKYKKRVILAAIYYHSSEPSWQGVYWTLLPGSVFVSSRSLETASLETPEMLTFALYSQHVPIQCNVLCREMRRQLSPLQDHWQPTTIILLSKMLRSLIPYLSLSCTFLSTRKVASVRDNTSAFSSLLQPFRVQLCDNWSTPAFDQ